MIVSKAEGVKIGGFLLILILAVTASHQILKEDLVLPIYNPSDLNKDVVDPSVQRVSKNHKIASFVLTDQDGKEVTEKDFDDKIYVADFFFVTCQSICPKMTKQMGRVQEEFLDDNDIKFISHSVTPELDTVEVLKLYAEKFGVVSGKWHLTTGTKKEIYDLARKSYFAVTTEGDGGTDDFIHTENFVLVDKNNRLRGFYDGTSSKEVDNLIRDIEILKREFEK
jgi:protein SCO1/2